MKAKLSTACFLIVALASFSVGCDHEAEIDIRDQQVGYRRGTDVEDYTTNGERGNVYISEVNWAGSVHNDGTHDPDDIFIEFQNKHPRPVHLTGWQILVRTGNPGRLSADPVGRPRASQQTFLIPARENGLPVQPNEFVTIAKKRNGAFRNADYYLEDLEIPADNWQLTLRDVDDRLIEGAGNTYEEIFAGGYDGKVVRSMERVQLIFSNRGSREASWHSYSFNVWDDEHEKLRVNVHEDYKDFTYTSPTAANTEDYSGNTAAGDFQ